MSPDAPAGRTVRCPRCGGASHYALANPWRPFCSERCKAQDFGAWASEAYKVTAPIDPQAPTDSESDDV